MAISVLMGIVGSLSAYALLTALFVLWLRPEGMAEILLRNLLIAVVGLFSVILLGRQAKTGFPGAGIAAVVLAAMVATGLLLYGYGWVYQRHVLDQRWRAIEKHAEQIRLSIGSTELELPSSHALYTIRRRHWPHGETTTRIAPNGPLVGRIFGLDLLAFDAVEVDQSASGVITAVRTDYF